MQKIVPASNGQAKSQELFDMESLHSGKKSKEGFKSFQHNILDDNIPPEELKALAAAAKKKADFKKAHPGQAKEQAKEKKNSPASSASLKEKWAAETRKDEEKRYARISAHDQMEKREIKEEKAANVHEIVSAPPEARKAAVAKEGVLNKKNSDIGTHEILAPGAAAEHEMKSLENGGASSTRER